MPKRKDRRARPRRPRASPPAETEAQPQPRPRTAPADPAALRAAEQMLIERSRLLEPDDGAEEPAD